MKRTTLLIILAIGLLSVIPSEERNAATTLRSGFEDRLVASVDGPTALAFTPDGRMLVASRAGRLRVYKDGELLSTPALDLSDRVCSNSERGLLGVAVDPDFATNRFVYVYYTFDRVGACPLDQPDNPDNPVNRVSRFVMSGDRIDPASQTVLVDNIPSPNGNHNGGDLKFGKDGYLYASIGDGACDYGDNSGCAGQNDASRDRNTLLGKVLRITRSGGIPSDNPFRGTDSARCNVTGSTEPGKTCQETFAWGFRNPFRMAFDPDADASGARLFVNDVGQNGWEEVDEAEAGADYGWNLCEGTHDNPSRPGSVDCETRPYTPPIHEYSHDAGCSSITGAAFVPEGASWPATYDDSYLFGDYVCGKIFELNPTSGGAFEQSEFASGLGQGGPIAMAFGSSGSGVTLHYTTFDNGGEVRRIAYAGANNGAPTAVVAADPSYGPVPLDVAFDGSGSSDPDGGALTYRWDFGDGSPPQTTDGPTTSHTYSTEGTYTAVLTVRDGSGAVDAARVRISAGNELPEPQIESPTPDETFAVGEELVLRGSANDPEDGDLPGGSLRWEVLQHHNNDHTHPYLSSTSGNEVEITAPAPEDLSATDPSGNYLEVRLTATDSAGRSRTVTRDLRPATVEVTFDSQPTGVSLQINGTTATTPESILSWEGYELAVSAPWQVSTSGTTYLFARWSDSGKRSHVITTPSEPATYSATYTPCTVAGTARDDVLRGTPEDDVICSLGGNDTLYGSGGEDTLRSGSGDDRISGGFGPDIVRGGQGEDYLSGDAGDDSIVAGPGDDELLGGEGDDNLDSKDGVGGNDSLDGGDGSDTCTTDDTEASIASCP